MYINLKNRGTTIKFIQLFVLLCANKTETDIIVPKLNAVKSSKEGLFTLL